MIMPRNSLNSLSDGYTLIFVEVYQKKAIDKSLFLSIMCSLQCAFAPVVELVDTLVSGTSAFTGMGVQVPPRAVLLSDTERIQ